MSPTDIQQLHSFLLVTLHGAGELGAQEDGILMQARLQGYRSLTAPQLSVELRALADRGWAVAYQPALGGQRWKIAGLGRAALQEAGLA
jgi:hypothetical protein